MRILPFAAAMTLGIAGFAPGVLAQSGNALCMEDLQKASNTCGAKNTSLVGQCMSEKAGNQCVQQFEAGKADAACEQKVKEAIMPCADKVRPAIMQCLSERVSAQCMEQSGLFGKAAK